MVLRALVPRVPGPQPQHVAVPALAAWSAHRDHTVMQAAAVRSVVDVAWRPGIVHGAADGHQFVANAIAAAARERAAGAHRAGTNRSAASGMASRSARHALAVIEATAWTIAGRQPSIVDTGPARADYATALGDWTDSDEHGRIAAAVRVGLTHGYQTGHALATWAAGARIMTAVAGVLGERALQQPVLDGASLYRWLRDTEVEARWAAEDHRHPPTAQRQALSSAGPPARESSLGRAFPALRRVVPADKVPSPTVDGAGPIIAAAPAVTGPPRGEYGVRR